MYKMTRFEGNFSDYKLVSVMGQCFEDKATVHLAQHVPSGAMVALKKFHMDKVKEESSLVDFEIILTKQLQHPNILQYQTSFVHGSNVYVVSPLMAYGSCRDVLNQHFNEGLPEQAIVIILRDLLNALDYVHKKGYIHRAIRASHILISSTGKVCLAGFRYACPIVVNGKWQRTIHSFPASTKANLNWLSPEVLEQNLIGYNEKSDLYSVGMVLCELANGSEPFSGMASTLMLTEKVRGAMPMLLDYTTIPKDLSKGDCELSQNVMNRRFSGDLHDVIGMCLNRVSYERPSAEQLLSHHIFRIIRKSLPLTELLKPAIPLSDRVAFNTDIIENLDNFSNLDIFSCDWDF